MSKDDMKPEIDQQAGGFNLGRREFSKLFLLLSAALSRSAIPHGAAQRPSRRQENSPSFLILVFDTLSAPHMSLHGYTRETTPNFARLAERATVFHRHYAGGSFTSSGTASLLTGVYPWTHRALHLHGSVTHEYTDRNIFSALAGTHFTSAYTHNPLVATLFHQFNSALDELIKIERLMRFDHSYSESLFFDDFAVAYESELLQLRNGNAPTSSLFLSIFDEFRRYSRESTSAEAYRELFPRGLPNFMDEERPSFLFFTLEDAVDWLTDELPTLPKPFLQYVHLLPPHGPYTTRKEFIDIFRDGWQPTTKHTHFFPEGHEQDFLNLQRRLYDEFIAYVDAEFGRLVEALDELKNIYLIVTSDHGQLFERGIHGHLTPTMYEGVIRIPLLIAQPGQETHQDVFTPTSCVDVLPTLLHLSGRLIPDWCEGEVLPGIGTPTMEDRIIFCVDAKRNAKHRPLSQATVAMITDEYKLVRYFGYDGIEEAYELFNLYDDPEERDNLYERELSLAANLKRELMDRLRWANNPSH
jgi:arylsulfatase A-like enzyme